MDLFRRRERTGSKDHDPTGSALGKVGWIVQKLIAGKWDKLAIDALEGYSGELAMLGRALVRNAATTAEAQQIVTMLDQGTLPGQNPRPYLAGSALLQLVFEAARGQPYSEEEWVQAMSESNLVCDSRIPADRLLVAASHAGLDCLDPYKQYVAYAPAFRTLSEVGFTGVEALGMDYPFEGACRVSYDKWEKEMDKVHPRADLSVAIACAILRPDLIRPNSTWVISGTAYSQGDDSDYPERFLALRRDSDTGALQIGRVEMERTAPAHDAHSKFPRELYSLRVRRVVKT